MPAGAAFKSDLQAYLTAYGQRGDTWGFSYPAWLEDPTPVIRNLQDYASQADRDAAKEQEHLAAERDQPSPMRGSVSKGIRRR